MSVSVTIQRLLTFPFPTSDVRYPTFRFVASGEVTGDASGGTATVLLQLRPAGGAPSGLLFGLRSLFAKVNGVGGDVATIAQRFILAPSQNQDEVISFPLVSAVTASTEVAAAINIDTLLGRADDPAGANSQIFFRWATNTLNLDYRAYVEGFIWQPQALFQGGPIFPGQFPPPT